MMSHTSPQRSVHNDTGMAMVLSLLFMLLLSALGTAVLVLARSETLSSVNYRMMSQARYGAESGVHKAAHFLLNSYTLPGTVADPLSNFDTTQTPVSYLGQPVVLSALPGVTANYPAAAVQTAFAAAGQGALPLGEATVVYTSSATLLSMREVLTYGAVTPTVVQTWRLTARGSIQGARQAEVEVSAVIERQIVPSTTYGLFATNTGCGALTATGGVQTDSYDSSNMTFVSGLPVVDLWGGHVGTNGNLTESGAGTIVRGSLSTPRGGVGNCRNGAITALDQNGNAQVTSGIIKLPQAVEYPLPAVPSPLPPTTTFTINGGSACSDVPYSSGACSITAGAVTLDPQGSPMTLGNINVTAGATLSFQAGTYNINSIKLTGNAIIRIASGPVVFNVAGTGEGTPVDLEGGGIINPTFMSRDFRILYAGTGELKLTGGTTTAASVFAPKASISISGGAHFFGSVIGAAITLTGGTRFHYDRWLEQEFFTVGPQMMSVFTWKEY
jgi:hypothetical protein